MAKIELDGVEYSTRKRTNKLRMELQPLVEEKQRAFVDQSRLLTEVHRIDSKSASGTLDEDDPALLAGYLEKLTKAAETQESILPKLAAKVLVGPDGKAPTAKLIDEHADLDELEHAVGVVLGTATENPTTAPPAGN